MKKTSWAVAVVAIVVVTTLLADRAWMKQHKPLARADGGAKAATLGAAPNAVFKDLQGNEVRLERFKGNVVLVNFWATWCEPCRVEIPWMIKFQQKYASRGFTVLGVAMDDEGRSAVEPFVNKVQWDVDGKQMAMIYPVVLGQESEADKFGGILGLPTSILISKDGKVVKRFIGLVTPETLSKDIEGLL